MDEIAVIFDNAKRVAARTGAEIVDHIPAFAGAAALLLVGWLVGRLLRTATRRGGNHVNRILDRAFRSGRLVDYRFSPGVLAAVAEVVFWLTLFVFASIAAKAAGLTAFAVWLDRIVANLPNLIAGSLVVVVGFFLGAIARDLMAATVPAGEPSRRALIGRTAQIAVVIAAVVIGLDQIGINVTFIITILAVVTAAVMGGFSIAFGLGAREFVANLIGSRDIRKDIELGQIVRFGEIEGEVVRITATMLILSTRNGRLRVPAALVSSSVIAIVDADDGHD